MTIMSEDHLAATHSFPGGYVKSEQIDHSFRVVALLSLFGLALTAAALFSGSTVDLTDLSAFLG